MCTIKVSTERNAYLATIWPHLAQVAQLIRSVTKHRINMTTTEIVYLITTLSPQQASPHHLLSLVRSHEGIDNRLHSVRDVTKGSDRSRLRSGNTLQVMAALRHRVVPLIRRFGSSQIVASRRYFSYQPQEALAFPLHHQEGQQ